MNDMIGHNEPPLAERLTGDYAEMTARMENLLASVVRMPVSIEDKALRPKFIDTAVMLKKLKSAATAAHKAEKTPFLEAGRTVDTFFKRGLIDPLADAVAKVEGVLSTYDRAVMLAEQKRRQEEARLAAEAERAAQEALAAEAATEADLDAAIEAEHRADEAVVAAQAPTVDLTRGHSDLGMASMSGRWTHELTVPGALDLNLLYSYFDIDAIDKAVARFVRGGGRELKGVRIYQEFKTIAR